MIKRLEPGSNFAPITVSKFGGGEFTLGKPSGDNDWQVIISYRGKFCPICTMFLSELNNHVADFAAAGIEVVAVSADPEEKVAIQMADVNPTYPVGYDLSLEEMRSLGLYVSHPASANETDHPFSEPGLFVVDGEGKLIVVSYSNVPAVRPDLSTLKMGLSFIKDPANNYPIRGTHD